MPRGDGWVYQPKTSRFWWMAFYRGGRLYRKSTGKENETEAGKVLQMELAQIRLGQRAPETDKIKMSELYQDVQRDYVLNGRASLPELKQHWRRLQPVFGHLKASNVTSVDVEKYKDQRLKEGAAKATINLELATLKRCFYLGMEQTPPKVVRVPSIRLWGDKDLKNARKGFVSDADYARLSEATGKRGVAIRAIFEMGYTYGWRISELLNLRVKQVDLLNRIARLETNETKNDDGREAPIVSDTLYQLLCECCKGKNPGDYVFTREKNGRQKPISDFRDVWWNSCVDAGLASFQCPKCNHKGTTHRCPNCKKTDCKYTGLLFHDLRRTAVRNLIRSGVSEKVAMNVSGHKTQAVFKRYHIVSNTDVLEALKRQQQFHAATQEAVRKNQPEAVGGHRSLSNQHITDTSGKNSTTDAGSKTM